MKLNRFLAIMLSVLMLTASMPIFGFAAEGAASTEVYVYKASDAWYEPAEGADVTKNTYNEHTEWKWQRKDSNKDWFDFAQFYTNKEVFGTTPPNIAGREKGAAWTTGTGAANHPAVGKGWMFPCGKFANVATAANNAVSRAFTAPKSGIVKLSTEDGFIYGGSKQPGVTNNRTAFIRITLNDVQIWPANGAQLRIPETEGQKYTFTPIDVAISKGDVLRFEVYNGDATDEGWGKYVWWKPIVTYGYEPQSISPADTSNVPLDQSFTLTFAAELEPLTKDNISINGGASVKNFSHNGNTITLDFDKLDGAMEYNVLISGVKIKGTNTELFSGFAFKTTYLTSYKATDSWYEPPVGADVTVNTYNEHTKWKWQRKDSGRDWFDFAKFHTDKNVFGTTPPDIAGREPGAAWTTNGGGSNHPAVGEGWMFPYGQKGHADYAVSRAFTVPESGIVTLSTQDGFIYGGSNVPGVYDNRAAFIRITRNDEQIWPANGGEVRIPETAEQTYRFIPIDVAVSKGDVLRFEVYNGDDDDAGWGKYTWWQPVVTYMNKLEVYNSYDALDALITARVNGTAAPASQWSWKNKRAALSNAQYIDFKPGITKTASMHLFAEPYKNLDGTYNYSKRGVQGTDQTNALYSTNNDDTKNTAHYNVMSRWWMRPVYMSGNFKKGDGIAKVFTAPKSGTVQISAVDADGMPRIYGRKIASVNQTSGAQLFIEKLAADGKPTLNADSAIYTHKFIYDKTDEDYAMSTDFAPITIDIKEGEKLWFIVNSEGDISGNAKFVHWNPVVTYMPFSFEANNAGVSFSKTDGTALGDFAAVVAEENVKVTLNAKANNAFYLADGESKTAVMYAAAYDSTGKMISVGKSAQITINKTSAADQSFVIENMAMPLTDTSGYIKVYLLDESLNSIGTVGSTPIFGTEAAVTSGSAFKGKDINHAGEAVTVTLSKDGDIKYIGQSMVGDDGSFRIPVPEAVAAIDGITCESNVAGKLYAPSIPLYVSSVGTADGDGTEAKPFDLRTALEQAEDKGTIKIVGEVPLGIDFEWPKTGRTVTISGNDKTSKLDISAITAVSVTGEDGKVTTVNHDFNIYSDVTFENLVIGCVSETNKETKKLEGKNRIVANGYHVIIKDSVTTETVIKTLIGGSNKASVDSTNLEVYGGDYNTILGGSNADGGGAVSVKGDCKLTVGGNVNSDIDETNWDYTYMRSAVIHGGGYGGTVEGESTLTLKESAKAKYVYGGQNGGFAAQNTGKVTVNVEGGNFMNVFAILKNTKNVSNKAVNVETDAELNMTGGTVEALIGAEKAILGNIRINALGGTVTRRIIGGTYNEVDKSSNTNGHVTGTTNVVIGKDLKLPDPTGTNNFSRGIYPGSRTTETFTEEVSTVIFLGDTYSNFANKLTDQYHNDTKLSTQLLSKSKWDYLVNATAGGTVEPTATAGTVTITPESGYKVQVNNEDYTAASLTLTKGEIAKVVFYKGDLPPKGITTVAYQDGNVTVDYNIDITDGVTFKLIVAAYDMQDNLVTYGTKDIATGSTSETVSLSGLDAAGQYKIKAMIWNSFNEKTGLVPQCAIGSTTIE